MSSPVSSDRLRKAIHGRRAFTLIELLVVIAVAVVLAALAVPAVKQFGRSNQELSATRQMLNAVGRARQLAIANRTTVYLVFLPTNQFSLPLAEESKAQKLAAGLGRSFALLSLRSIGDQPGQSRPQYLSEWQSLPQGWIIAPSKFSVASNWFPNANYGSFGPKGWGVLAFDRTNSLPFPSAQGSPGFWLPYIAFDYSGQLISGTDEFIPIARGAVDGVATNAGANVYVSASVTESPPGNSLSEYRLIHIDWLTGRARLETRKIE